MRNVIFTQRVDIIESYNERRDCADQRISEFICACGFLPVPMPNSFSAELIEKFLCAINPSGIIFTGGNSLVKYGGNAPERDFTERELLRISLTKKIPVYAFCRGMQFVLDYFSQELENVSGHVATRHRLISDKKIFDGQEVNSYHNQACKKIKSDEIISLAHTQDGIIEAICSKNNSIFCTMWHPEREKTFLQRDINLVKNLFNGDEITL